MHGEIGPKVKMSFTNVASIEAGSTTDKVSPAISCFSFFLLFVHGIKVSVYIRFSSPSLIYSAEPQIWMNTRLIILLIIPKEDYKRSPTDSKKWSFSLSQL